MTSSCAAMQASRPTPPPASSNQAHDALDGGDGLRDVAAVAVHRGKATESRVPDLCCGAASSPLRQVPRHGRSRRTRRSARSSVPAQLGCRPIHRGARARASSYSPICSLSGRYETVSSAARTSQSTASRSLARPHRELWGDLSGRCSGASEGPGHGTVEISSLRGEHVLVDRVAHEVMAKRESSAIPGDVAGEADLQPGGNVDR